MKKKTWKNNCGKKQLMGKITVGKSVKILTVGTFLSKF